MLSAKERLLGIEIYRASRTGSSMSLSFGGLEKLAGEGSGKGPSSAYSMTHRGGRDSRGGNATRNMRAAWMGEWLSEARLSE